MAIHLYLLGGWSRWEEDLSLRPRVSRPSWTQHVRLCPSGVTGARELQGAGGEYKMGIWGNFLGGLDAGPSHLTILISASEWEPAF